MQHVADKNINYIEYQMFPKILNTLFGCEYFSWYDYNPHKNVETPLHIAHFKNHC